MGNYYEYGDFNQPNHPKDSTYLLRANYEEVQGEERPFDLDLVVRWEVDECLDLLALAVERRPSRLR